MLCQKASISVTDQRHMSSYSANFRSRLACSQSANWRICGMGPEMFALLPASRIERQTLSQIRRAAEAAALIARLCSTVWGTKLRSEEHTSELQSLMRISYAVFCLKKKK